MEIGAIILSVLKLGFLILTEIFQAKKRAREKEEKFELTQAVFEKAAQTALEKMRSELKQDAQDAQSIEDQMDQERRK